MCSVRLKLNQCGLTIGDDDVQTMLLFFLFEIVQDGFGYKAWYYVKKMH
jgi:hypothetical protein